MLCFVCPLEGSAALLDLFLFWSIQFCFIILFNIWQVADVQAELQQYLNSKNINGLFIQIVESLLIEKPANPVAFMIEYLFKQFPDQAKAAGIGGPTAE